MTSGIPPPSTEEAKAAGHLARGSFAGIVGALLGVVVPVALLLVAGRNAGGWFAFTSAFLATTDLFAVVGAFLLLLAFILYRRAFVRLKHVDPRLRPAAALALAGSIGALVLVVAGAWVAGGTSTLTGCLAGRPSHILSCLRASDPAIGYLALAGFTLAWIGGVGVVAGLALAARHYGRGAITAGAVVYAVFLLDLLIPLAGLLTVVPGTVYAVGVAPVAAVLAPALVRSGVAGQA